MPVILGCSGVILIVKAVWETASLLSCSGWQRLLSALCGATALRGNPPDLWNDGGDVLSESCNDEKLMCLYLYLLLAGGRAALMVQCPRGS